MNIKKHHKFILLIYTIHNTEPIKLYFDDKQELTNYIDDLLLYQNNQLIKNIIIYEKKGVKDL